LPPGARKPPIGDDDDENGDAGRGELGAAAVADEEVGALARDVGAGLNACAEELAGAVVGACTTGVLTAGDSAFLATLRLAVFFAGLVAAAFFATVVVRFLAAAFMLFFFLRPAATALLPAVLVFLAFVAFFALFTMIILPIVRGDSSIAQ
jgi:hypothetical protein